MPETCIKFGKHGARVMIENKEIEHYDSHVDPAKKEVSCWIASEEGKKFSVVWLDLGVKYTSACDLHLDGHFTKSIVREGPEPIIIEDGLVSEESSAPFVFSLLAVTDDDTYLETSPPSIGEIKLVISRTTKPKKMAKQHTQAIDRTLLHLQKVHERSKKGITHRVNYGSEFSTPRTSAYSSKTLETLATFIFRYRPLETLRANDIVPRNPESLESQEHTLDVPPTSETSSGKGEHSKVKEDVESGLESDSDDEYNMRENTLLAELEKIRKDRHLKDSKRPKKKLKTEDKPLFTPGEIIDLT